MPISIIILIIIYFWLKALPFGNFYVPDRTTQAEQFACEQPDKDQLLFTLLVLLILSCCRLLVVSLLSLLFLHFPWFRYRNSTELKIFKWTYSHFIFKYGLRNNRLLSLRLNLRCASEHDCYWDPVNSHTQNAICEFYKEDRLYQKDFHCSYCCDRDYCNLGVVPPRETVFLSTVPPPIIKRKASSGKPYFKLFTRKHGKLNILFYWLVL